MGKLHAVLMVITSRLIIGEINAKNKTYTELSRIIFYQDQCQIKVK